MTGAVPTPIGILMLQIQIGDFMQVHKRTTMTTHGDGDLRGDGMVVTAHIGAGAGTAAGAGVQVCPGVGADHSAGAGEALSDGEARIGDMDTLLTGEDIMIRSGEEATVTLTGAGAEATGVMDIITDLSTEEAAEEDSVILV